MSRRIAVSLLTFAALAATVAGPDARAQPLGLPPPGAPVPVENVSPRVTGNSFLQTWRADDLDAGPSNTDVLQHPATGYIYVGNSAGVLEFDGARWRLLPLPLGGAVLALAIDVRGRLWAAAENEIARLEPEPRGGALRAVTIRHPLPEGEQGAMNAALAAGDGVWFRGLQHVLRIAPDDTVATWKTNERFGPIWLMAGAVHTVVSEREVVRLDEGGRLTPVLSRDNLRVPPARPSPLRVFASRQVTRDETILLTALGPVRWSQANKTWRPFPMRPALFREAEALAAAFLPDGAMVFVTTRPGGIVVTSEGRLERLLDRVPAVMNPRVNSLAADREGGLWLTSRDHVTRLQLRSAFARHEGAQGLQGSPRDLLRHDGTLYVAHTGGVSRHVPWPGAFPPADALQRGAEELTIAGGRVFAAATGLVEVIHGGNGTLSWSDRAITTVAAVGGRGDVLLAGDAQGVWVFRAQGADWKPEGRLEKLGAGVSTIFDRRDGYVWGATTDGRIWRADFRAGVRLDAPVAFYGAPQGVPTPVRARRIRFFPLGNTTVATTAGWLLRHEAAADRFVPETRIAGIGAPAQIGAEAVGINADGSVWLRLGAPDRRILRAIADGPERWRTEELPAPMIRDLPAVALCEDARTLWVAGTDLLVSIDLDWRADTGPLPAPRVRRVVRSGDEAIATNGDGAEAFSLAAGEPALRFEFAAPSFVTDHRGRACVQYRTQLAGLEREWSAWSAEPWRDYTRLPAGRYTFRVQATDQAGKASPTTTLRFSVTAPWWRTPGAWAGYAAGGGLIVLGAVALRTRSLRRRAEELERVVAARTEELRRTNAELARLHRLELDEKSAARLAEEQARLEVLRYQLNPHFLYNALNSVYSLTLTAPPAAANMVLKLADFCRVALDRRGEDQTTVGAEFDKLATYLDIEKVRWGDSLHIAIEADEAARAAPIPPFLLLPLVENAIKYGGATSTEELHVRVTAKFSGERELELTVANTGRWVQDTVATGLKSSGIGLTNLRQRLERRHPGAHALTIETSGGWVTVRLRIPVCAAQEVHHE